MSEEKIVLLWDFIKLIISGAVGAYVVHLLTNRRLKKEQQNEIINKQIHQVYAPLLIQVFLLKREIQLWENIQKREDEKSDSTKESLREDINAHHIENIISFRQNILNLISSNFGFISEKNKSEIMEFLGSTNDMTLIKSKFGYFVFTNEEVLLGNPLPKWKNALNELQTKLDHEISLLKEKLKMNGIC